VTHVTGAHRTIVDEPVAVEVDAIGMACPMPVIELAKAVDGVEVGDRVRLVADDAAARVDVPVWCRMQRHRLLSQEQREDGALHFVVERQG
jgi:TusA-related sulfurtransferase